MPMHVILRKSVIALLGLAFFYYCGLHAAQAGVQSYTVEDINDPDFLAYPPPPPEHPSTYQFTISGSPHDEVITISSTRLRNISITLENNGSTLIKAPYLYGRSEERRVGKECRSRWSPYH